MWRVVGVKYLSVDVCIYSTCPFCFVLFYFDSHVDVANVQRRELVKFYGVERCIRVIIIIITYACDFGRGGVHEMATDTNTALARTTVTFDRHRYKCRIRLPSMTFAQSQGQGRCVYI